MRIVLELAKGIGLLILSVACISGALLLDGKPQMAEIALAFVMWAAPFVWKAAMTVFAVYAVIRLFMGTVRLGVRVAHDELAKLRKVA